MRHTGRRIRYSKNKTLKKRKLSSDAKSILNQYSSKYDISKILYGRKAFDAATKILFPDSDIDKKKWATQFSTSKKNSSVFFIATNKHGPGKEMKLIMGEGSNLSVIGERILI